MIYWSKDLMIQQSNISKVLTTLWSSGINYGTLACDVNCEFLHWPWAFIVTSLGNLIFNCIIHLMVCILRSILNPWRYFDSLVNTNGIRLFWHIKFPDLSLCFLDQSGIYIFKSVQCICQFISSPVGFVVSLVYS